MKHTDPKPPPCRKNKIPKNKGVDDRNKAIETGDF